MKFKRIYIEITNVCNLNCSFCPPHNRENKFMSVDDFTTVLSKIKDYTKYIYLHVKGEPLFHPNITEMLKIAAEKGFFINLTTNGTLLKEHMDILQYIRQINISLHGTNDIEIIRGIKNVKNSIIQIRLWNKGKDAEIIRLLEKEFDIEFRGETNTKITENIYISYQEEFEWPKLGIEKGNSGFCYALKHHIGILVDGTVVPCCLDNNGDINLGNIFNEDLNEILENPRAKNMVKCFNNRILIEPLCKGCGYISRLIKNK